MTQLEVVALALASAWLGLLTFIVLLLVRQLGLITVALATPQAQYEDGLPVGSPVPRDAKEVLPILDRQLAYLLFLSPTCGSCVGLMNEMATRMFSSASIFAVLPGVTHDDELTLRVPAAFSQVEDPAATAIAEALQVHTTPYALQVENGIVTGKAIIQDAADLERLIVAYEHSDAAEIARNLREVVDSAG